MRGGSPRYPRTVLQRRIRPLSVPGYAKPFSALISHQPWFSWNDQTQFTRLSPNPNAAHNHYPNISNSNSNNTTKTMSWSYNSQQVRFRRHDRASAFMKPRPHTKKQRQEYNRKKKRLEDEAAKHNPPGSTAGPHRQWVRQRREQLLQLASTSNELLDPSSTKEENQEYGFENALLDDVMGNTAYLTSQPTPEPAYFGHLHKVFYNTVADQMDRYHEAVEALKRQNESGNENDAETAVLDPAMIVAELPSDLDIAKVLKAYRDRHGTRSKPLGIAKALQHIMKDLGVPTMAFGEHTYTSLLTCCRTPKEVRLQ